MRRATTPTLTISINQNLNGYWYRVALKQGSLKPIIKTEEDCVLSEDGHTIEVTLTQKETLSFYPNNRVQVQVRFGKGDSVVATDIAEVNVDAILDEVIIQ